jgi:hypothetical protein
MNGMIAQTTAGLLVCIALILFLLALLLVRRLDGERLDLAHLLANTRAFAEGLKVLPQQLELLLEVFLSQRAQE